ncbi:methyltransferase [Maribrevibacterium harenarium]|uniref:Methyltransferase n=1 Tax=Maribrevibacterium harenarium TaxID=2589817 RepID=A0A501X597_9GAMM|nr:methyltransferase [Maribrevibacterium harenarium]TPE55621.1 methyltransferase [Maribrevibacterium harenarium]
MTVIYQCQDEFGQISVIDDGKFRLLSFAEGDEQSRIWLQKPHVLQHEYTQAMVLPLLFAAPKRITLLGLGGGTLVGALNQVCNKAHIHAVELRHEIITIAQEFFRLPSGKRITLEQGDAFAYLDNPIEKKQDWLMTDLYQHFGMDKRVLAEHFVAQCKQQLKSDGMLILNCWTEHRTHPDLNDALSQHFAHIYGIDTGAGNWVIFATNHWPELSNKAAKDYCQQLESSLGFSLQKWWQRLECVK